MIGVINWLETRMSNSAISITEGFCFGCAYGAIMIAALQSPDAPQFGLFIAGLCALLGSQTVMAIKIKAVRKVVEKKHNEHVREIESIMDMIDRARTASRANHDELITCTLIFMCSGYKTRSVAFLVADVNHTDAP